MMTRLGLVLRQVHTVLAWTWHHPANRHRRLRGVTRAVAFQLKGRLGLRTQITLGRAARMWVAPRAGSKAVYGNPPDWNEMQAWRRILAPGDLFVDVGASVGPYTLWAADAGAHAIAVEPNPQAAARLRENVGLNDLLVEIRQCALADRPGRMRLTRGLADMNHLVRGATEDASDCDEVEVDTLDRLLGDRTAVGVKIDVEGFERFVLEGAKRALTDGRIRVLQVEWNRESEHNVGENRLPTAALLSRYGYRFMRPDRAGVLRPLTDPPSSSSDDLFAVAPGYTERAGVAESRTSNSLMG
jgi:FkbM family methyltransferase